MTFLGLVARTGLPKTTVHRTVRKMIELGWLECEGGRYGIGTRLFERATLTGRRMFVREAALPFMQDLCATTHETIHLAVLDGSQIVYLEKLVGHRASTNISRVGGRMPALCTGLGKVLTTFAPEHRSEEIVDAGLEPRTPNTVTHPAKIRRELARVGEEGVAFDREESVLRIGCVAAPVRATDGSCVAAISMTGLADRVPFTRLAPVVRRAAQLASHMLASTSAGWRENGAYLPSSVASERLMPRPNRR